MTVVGVLFGLTSIPALIGSTQVKRDVGGAVLVILFGMLLTAIGLSLLTAGAYANPQELRYRYGAIRFRIPATDITSITIGRGSGVGYPRTCLHVATRQGKVYRLTGLQQQDTEKSRLALSAAASRLVETLGLGEASGDRVTPDEQNLRLLRAVELSDDYKAAWQDWSGSEDDSLWNVTGADGVTS